MIDHTITIRPGDIVQDAETHFVGVVESIRFGEVATLRFGAGFHADGTSWSLLREVPLARCVLCGRARWTHDGLPLPAFPLLIGSEVAS